MGKNKSASQFTGSFSHIIIIMVILQCMIAKGKNTRVALNQNQNYFKVSAE